MQKINKIDIEKLGELSEPQKQDTKGMERVLLRAVKSIDELAQTLNQVIEQQNEIVEFIESKKPQLL